MKLKKEIIYSIKAKKQLPIFLFVSSLINNIFIESGSMQLIKDNENIKILTAGEGFGEAALLCNEPRYH